MSMVLIVRVTSDDELQTVLGNDDDLFDMVNDGNGWESENGLAVLDVLFGPDGIDVLGGQPISVQEAVTPVMDVSPTQAQQCLHDATSNPATGDPELDSDAASLYQLIETAATQGNHLLWVVA